jgi:SAM-dependent methyltransferase
VARHIENGWWDTPTPFFDEFIAFLPSDARVLDLGCGPGSDTAHFRTCGFRAFGLDRSVGMLAEARARVGAGFALGDMRHLPLPTAFMDGVWMQASLLHLPRQTAPQVLSEVCRALRPGGALYISVKQGDGEMVLDNLSGQPRFFTLYQPDVLAVQVSGAGFQIKAQWLKETPAVNWICLVAVKLAD